MSALQKRTGSCLCKMVKLEMTGSPVFTNNCHCVPCQKKCAAAFTSNVAYHENQVKYTLADPSVLKTYEDSTPESGSVLSRSFCGNCGSGVTMSTTSRPGIVSVGLGIIDGDRTDLKPRQEFFCDRKLPWVAPVAGAEGFPKMPPT